MYDLNKIIIIGDYTPNQQEELQTIVMVTDGLRVDSLLYLDDINSLVEKGTVREQLKSELYSDQYDEDNLKIKVKEVINGEHAMNKVSKFINKYWTPDTLVYYYRPNEQCFNILNKNLLNIDSRIYLCKYHDIFIDKNNIEKPIYEIMKDEGLKTQNLIQDSIVSLAYFLSCLVEKILSK